MKIYAAILLVALAVCAENPATPDTAGVKTSAPDAPMKDPRRMDAEGPYDYADRMTIDALSGQEAPSPTRGEGLSDGDTSMDVDSDDEMHIDANRALRFSSDDELI
jgi:hypothetical protein